MQRSYYHLLARYAHSVLKSYFNYSYVSSYATFLVMHGNSLTRCGFLKLPNVESMQARSSTMTAEGSKAGCKLPHLRLR